MSEPTWYIQQQGERESQEAAEVDDTTTMREAEDDEDEFYDDEYEDRKKILIEVMERHPEMAFTGDSVRRYLDSGDELESATMEDAHLEAAYEDRYIDLTDY